jgi:predicted permease
MTHRHAWRSLQRTPAFTVAVILTLVLGIASAGSMFAVVYGVLLAPLGYGEPDRLVSVGLQTPKGLQMPQPPALYLTYKQYAKTIDDVGFYRTGSSNVYRAGNDDVAESVVGTWVTASMMPLLQIPPLLGRSFSAEEEIRGGPDAVILSEAEWRSRFDAAPDVIGKTLMVNSVPRQVIGVMPAQFSFPTADTRVWLPVKYTDSATVGDFSLGAVARLAPGATAEQAQRELAALLPRMAETYPQMDVGGSTASWLAELNPSPVVVPLLDQVTGDISRTLWMLAAAAGLVLLVAWANVANLMLIRADGRQLELGIRASLGASRWRIASHFFGESLLLGATAGAIALLATFAAVHALVAFGPADVPRLAELGVGLPTVGFIVVLTAAAVIACAALPAVRMPGASLSTKLHDGGRGASTGKVRQRLRATITVLQIALALVVSVGSALLLRSAQQLSEVDPGFDASEVTTIRTQLPYARYNESDGLDFYTRLTERVSQLPFVRAAGLAKQVPLASGWTFNKDMQVEGDARTQRLLINVVDEGYFAAMKVPLLAGSNFRRTALAQNDDIIISQSAAATLFGNASNTAALGKRLTIAPGGPTYTIIGIVGDVRDRDLVSPPVALVYRPPVVAIDPNIEAGAPRNMALVVRASGPSDSVVAAIRQIVREIDPAVALFGVETMSDVLRASTARLTLMLTLMTAAAVITLLLGAIGLYSVMAYLVALRTREFGVRVALGADPRRIARLVIARGLVLTAIGIAAGFVLYGIAAPFLRAFLYGVTATDPVTLVGATAVLVGTAALASWLPARRAARVDPAEALRAE